MEDITELCCFFFGCSTGAGPDAADGYHWTGGACAEQARGGTCFTLPPDNN